MNKIQRLFCTVTLLFSVFGMSVSTEAADRYVSTAGDDAGNDCSSPASPCATVAHAVASATNYDVIKLAQGIYTENIEISTTLNSLDLKGGWNADFSHQSDNPALTILEGDTENPVITIMAQLVNLNVSIEGFDIRKGRSGISALSLGASLELNVSNCIVKDNVTSAVIEDPDPLPIIELAASDPVSELSYLGSGIAAFSIYTGMVSLSVKDCLIRGNRGFFGGVSVAAPNATLTIEDSAIENNVAAYGAGGVTVLFQGGNNNTATLKRNRIIGNGGARGGGILIVSDGGKTAAALENNMIINNNLAVGGGGGVAVLSRKEDTTRDETTVTLTNNTIFDNTASAGDGLGGGVYAESDDSDNITRVTAENCIIWGNTAAVDGQDVAIKGNVTFKANYCDIDDMQNNGGTYTPHNNLNTDPLFVNPNAGDFHLQKVSPLIDAGIILGWMLIKFGSEWVPITIAPREDVEGDLREPGLRRLACCDPVLGADIGADEHILLASPAGQESWVYDTALKPARRDLASQCEPFAAGGVAGGNVDLKVGIPELSELVDIYLALYAPSISDNIFLITSDHSFQPLSSGLVQWRTNTTGNALESLFGSIPASAFPDGPYFLAVYITPVGNPDAYYMWATSFEIP